MSNCLNVKAQGTDVKLIKKEYFESLQTEQMEIIGCSDLKKPNKKEKSFEANGKYFRFIPEKKLKTIGYMVVSKKEFIKIVKAKSKAGLVFLYVLLGLIIAFSVLYLSNMVPTFTTLVNDFVANLIS